MNILFREQFLLVESDVKEPLRLNLCILVDTPLAEESGEPEEDIFQSLPDGQEGSIKPSAGVLLLSAPIRLK